MIPALPHLSSRIFNTPLLVDAGKLQTILGVLGQKAGVEIHGPLEAGHGFPFPSSRNEPASERISVIPVHGSLVYRSMGLSPQSGMRSYEDIRRDFREALEADTVGILLDIDSPGGEVSGVFDLVDEIYQARGRKPIYAVANEAALSAAYAIASAADKVYVPRTGWLGSIGVIAVHVDQSGFDYRMGIRYEPITAGAHKAAFNPHSNTLSNEAREWLQQAVDETYAMFVETVARNRGMSVQAVRDTEARVYQGVNAVQAGLADAVMSIAQVTAKLERKGGTKMHVMEQTEPVVQDLPADPVTPEETPTDTQEAPAGSDNVRDAVSVAALQAERERIAEILALCRTFKAWLPDGFEEKLIREGVDLNAAKNAVLDCMAKAQEKNGEIRSSVNPMVMGSHNPLIADAERRARRKEA